LNIKLKPFNFDGTLKELFEKDRPRLLERLTGGIRVRSFLNVDLAKVVARRADLAMMLEDDSVFHLEFQGKNAKLMVYRMGLYGVLLGQKLPWRRIRSVVLYAGEPKMSMRNEFDMGSTKLGFELIDIREIDAETLIESDNPGDNVLALLAGGGSRKIERIVQRLGRLKEPGRGDALAQLSVLAGLRNVVREAEWEVKRMGVIIDVKKNPILMEWHRQMEEQVNEDFRQATKQAREEGLEEGREKGLEKGQIKTLLTQMETKFGRLPKWARHRVTTARRLQLERYAKKILDADTLESVIGKR
jgi:hypothetical protein